MDPSELDKSQKHTEIWPVVSSSLLAPLTKGGGVNQKKWRRSGKKTAKKPTCREGGVVKVVSPPKTI